MAKTSLKIEGKRQLIANLKKFAQKYPNAVGGALTEEAKSIIAKAIPITPKRTGVLSGSYVMSKPKVTGDNIEVMVGVGGAGAKDYAIPIHEGKGSRFAPASWRATNKPLRFTTPGTGTKYLAKAVKEISNGYYLRLYLYAKKAIEKMRFPK